MGLSIHYSGTIKDKTLIDALVIEVADICKSLNWSHDIIKESNDDYLKGIWFSPKDCEPVFLTFLPDGRMCSPINLMNKDLYLKNGLDIELVYTTSTKTQFAGPDAHMSLIKLLCHLKEKYFSVFDLTDEGMYWETMDESVLLDKFAKYDFLIDAVGAAISELECVPSETASSLADRIEKLLIEGIGRTQQNNVQ